MNFSLPVVKILWTRARNECAFPTCHQSLTEDSVDTETGEPFTFPIAQQAHIRSYKENGPRYDPDYPQDKLHSYENLILLCPTHHTMVDANKGAAYSVDDLVEMRERHEKQITRRDGIDATIQKYVAQRYGREDKVLFEQVDLNGPSVDSLFVDVPFACRSDADVAGIMETIARDAPGDVDDEDRTNGLVVTGAAQALLHPGWKGNGLLVGGPGQGKSTLLQYVCQFYRARLLGKEDYTGQAQQLRELTAVDRVPIRLDLREYAKWAPAIPRPRRRDRNGKKVKHANKSEPSWRTLEEYISHEVARASGGFTFTVEDLGLLVSTKPVVLALDGLDEVANLKYREEVSAQIVDTQARLDVDAADLTVLVATRPGGATSALWSSDRFPRLTLRRLTLGLRLQYLQRWSAVAKLSEHAADKLQQTFVENQNSPHIRELASYPMQLAILLHLLHRRQLLPQRRTDLYNEYFTTFLDREQTEDKEPLLATERRVIEDIHTYIGWHIHAQTEEGQSSGSISRSDLEDVVRNHLEGREDGQAIADQLLAAVTTRLLCLVERDPGSGEFQFEVQSLREYFAAMYLFDEVDRDKRDECLNALLRRPYWSNVSRFLVGKYSKGEVRGMRSVLQEIGRREVFKLHPMLRSTATLFLNDRTYEGQKDEPLQEVVDFILGGPGVILAEDGLLDVGGALQLSERAGRVQAVRHLKARLEAHPQPTVAIALASSLRRHSNESDGIKEWWWDRFEPSGPWLEGAVNLRILDNLAPANEQKLVSVISSYEPEAQWITSMLGSGGYKGNSDDVLVVVKSEINDGAACVLHTSDPASSVGRMLNGARLAVAAPNLNVNQGETTSGRVRLRGSGTSILSDIMKSAVELRIDAQATTELSAAGWRNRLARIVQVWGDGWVLRQAVAFMPGNADFDQVIGLVSNESAELHAALTLESDARQHRKDIAWWADRLKDNPQGLGKRHWLFSILTQASSTVVCELADDIDNAVQSLTPRYFDSLRGAIVQSRSSMRTRELVLHEELRLNRIKLSPKSLWLIRAVAADATIEWIDKRLGSSPELLLATAVSDLRGMVRVADGTRVFKFEWFRGLRTALPPGGWASGAKIGSLSLTLAEQVLTDPHEWPSDLVQRAVQVLEEKMLTSLKNVATTAQREDWFQE
ncbi:NACHT domain-containing protein [Mycobacteroides abscessus]|uniref:NACHT domain-containing protein n=1 Tax=Mycobacteroides abscessus TaxID=36809 RepID=UPI0010420C11|nr:HNH endonuclease [Mycobacteroides abscessus]